MRRLNLATLASGSIWKRLTIHVIGLRVKGFSWTGEQSILDAKCLAEKNGGLYITAENEDVLLDALEKTLGCPMVTQGVLPRWEPQVSSLKVGLWRATRGRFWH